MLDFAVRFIATYPDRPVADHTRRKAVAELLLVVGGILAIAVVAVAC